MSRMSNIYKIRKGWTYLAVNKFDVVRTLSITISGSILRSGLIGRKPRQPSVCIHLHEVKCAVETARKLRHVNVECEFLVLQVEHVVGRFIFKKVDTRADVGVRARGDELEREGAATCGDTVGSLVIRTIDSTVLFE